MKHLLGLSLALFFLFSLFVLQGCTPVQTNSGSVTITKATKQAWQKRQQTLKTASKWRLNSRASVTYRDENWPFSLQWQQHTINDYELTIYHPLTRNRLGKLTKQANTVSFIDAKGRTYRDTSAERLLQKQLRIKIPIEGMQYWVRGIAAPQYSVEAYQLDAVGRPVILQQAGWTVSYADYKGRAYDALPQRINIFRAKPESIKVKMRIKQWGAL